MPFLIAEYSFAFDIIDFLESYEAKTLHVCPFTVDVISGQENDIKQTLAAITEDDCWSVEYTQKDSVVALKDPYKSIESCESDADCCDPWDRCGFPDSQRKCLYDPDDSSRKGCFTPLFRVSVFTEDQVTVVPPGSGFNPTADRSDERLCSLLPEFAPYEELCDDNPYGVYEPCDPPRYHDLEVPNDAECSFIYGLTLMALDFPEGNAALPEGGRAIIGFDFHGTPDHTRVPKFQIPSLQTNALEGSSIAGFQSYFRDAKPIPDGRYQAIPGHLFAKASLGSIPDELQMPSFLSMPSQSSVIDAGLEVTVVFIPEDPTIWPDPTLEQAYSVAEAMSVPVWSVHELPGVPTVSTHPESEMIGMVLSRVDRVDVQFDHDYWAWNGELIMEDPLWRIYAPAGTTSISLPPEFNPFRIRNEVWVTPWAGSFSTPFEYDLFLPGQILGQMSSYAQDSYAVVAP